MGRTQSWRAIRPPAKWAWRCSRTFLFGPLCRGRARVGAVATHRSSPAYGPKGLDRLSARGQRAAGARGADRGRPLARGPPGRGDRRRGKVAAHTEADCIDGRRPRGRRFISRAGQLDEPVQVPQGMSDAFWRPNGPSRTHAAALLAAEKQGGDIRGRQSAAMVVVPADGEPWRPRRSARRGSRGPARRAAPPAPVAARLQPGRRGRRAARRRDGPTRRAFLYRPGRGARPALGRAPPVLVRPGDRPGGRSRSRRRRRAARRRREPELAGPPRTALTGIRSGRRRGPRRPLAAHPHPRRRARPRARTERSPWR